jgi:hypothetical protein
MWILNSILHLKVNIYNFILVRSNRYTVKRKSNDLHEMNEEFLTRLNASVLLDSSAKHDKEWIKHRLHIMNRVLPARDSIKSGHKFITDLCSPDNRELLKFNIL